MGKGVMIKMNKAKRYIIYWHKFANSGIWGYDNKETAYKIANDFAKQDKMYDVSIIDVKEGTIDIIKGDKSNCAKEIL